MQARIKEYKQTVAREEVTTSEEIDVEQFLRKNYPKEVAKIEDKLKSVKWTSEQVERFEAQAEELLEK